MNDNTTSHTAVEYDSGVVKTIPYYTEFHPQALDLIRQKGDVKHLLDVGCGTGLFEAMLLDAFPEVQITAVDSSEQMLEQARLRICSEQIQYLCRRAEEMDYKAAFDVVTAIQVHHYLHEDQRELATRNAYWALKPGGLYISFENVIPEAAELRAPELERWKRFQISRGKTPEQAEAHARRCGVNYFPISVEQHIALLRKTGFRLVYVFWKSYMQMGILGIK